MSLARKSEDILVAFAAQVLYFRVNPHPLSLVGAAIILVCILLSLIRNIVGDKAEAPQWVKSLFCLEPNTNELDNEKSPLQKQKEQK